MSMYKVFESAMSATFDLPAMLEKINQHHILGNLTDGERDKLSALARSKADPSGGLNVMAILADHDARLRTLEAAKGETSDGTEAAVAEYVPGKWYRKGDRVSYRGAVCVCTAPDGQVCVWSPEEYPEYWEAA